jgi:hypothetical protein
MQPISHGYERSIAGARRIRFVPHCARVACSPGGAVLDGILKSGIKSLELVWPGAREREAKHGGEADRDILQETHRGIEVEVQALVEWLHPLDEVEEGRALRTREAR